MDKIKVSVGALTTAENALRELSDNICSTIDKCKSDIEKEFYGIDDNLQNDLFEYFDDLDSLKKSILTFKTETHLAISARLNLISEYSATAYKQRDIL